MTGLSPREMADLNREAEKWMRDDALAGRTPRTLQQIKQEILRARRSDRIRQINLAVEKLKNWAWSLEHAPEAEENFRLDAERRLEPLLADSPYLEYGTEWVVPATRMEIHGKIQENPEHIAVYWEDSRQEAEKVLREDMEAVGASEPRGKLVWRRRPGPTREVRDGA